MRNVFVGWGGNKSLADEVKNCLSGENYNVIVGGGAKTDTFVGAQVIDQINQCDCAILLVEDYNGQISPNLLFEWGYILAYKDIKNRNIQIFMIDKSPRELPSDLLGVWAIEMKRDKGNPDSDKILAEKISKRFLETMNNDMRLDYFSILNEWTTLRVDFAASKKHMTEREFEENAVIGCLAAYYYNDNRYLKEQLDKVTGSTEFNQIILFAKSYIDVFLKSNNMAKPISTADFFNNVNVFDAFLHRQFDKNDNFNNIMQILCYDVYGLSNLLYLKNEDLDEVIQKECREQALRCFEQTLELTDVLSRTLNHNECLIHLIRAYIYNDTAHLYKQHFNNNEEFLKYLELSVNERQKLHLTFCAKYPSNSYFANKLEQEYMIALSEKCLYMDSAFMRKMSIDTIKTKYSEWKSDVDYVCSLIKRIEGNLKLLEQTDK